MKVSLAWNCSVFQVPYDVQESASGLAHEEVRCVSLEPIAAGVHLDNVRDFHAAVVGLPSHVREAIVHEGVIVVQMCATSPESLVALARMEEHLCAVSLVTPVERGQVAPGAKNGHRELVQVGFVTLLRLQFVRLHARIERFADSCRVVVPSAPSLLSHTIRSYLHDEHLGVIILAELPRFVVLALVSHDLIRVVPLSQERLGKLLELACNAVAICLDHL